VSTLGAGLLGSGTLADADPPETTIDVGPSASSYDRQPTFEFSADEPGSTFQLRLTNPTWPGGSPWVPVTSPLTSATPLPFGEHLVEIRAIDSAGNVDPTPAEWAWTILEPVPSIHVRELPPLRISHFVELPNGRPVRWGADESNPANVPSGVEHVSSMPGGFESARCDLARKPEIDYGDPRGFATWTIHDAAGEVISETRIQRAADGDKSISPEGVGWQAHLEDDKTASFVPIDRDLGRWQGVSARRRNDLKGVGGNDTSPTNDGQAIADLSTGLPMLRLELSGHMPGGSFARAESWYDAGAGNRIAGLIFGSDGGVNHTNGNFNLAAFGDDTDTASGVTAAIGSVSGGTTLATAYRAFDAAKRWAHIRWLWSGGAYTADEHERWRDVRDMAVIGYPALPLYGAAGAEGVLASDVVAYALERWAPGLTFTVGPNGSIVPTTFVIPHLPFNAKTTVGEMIRQALRFELPDWAVWAKRTFHMHPRGERGRRWKFRTGPTKLKSTGQDTARVWNAIMVSFRDPDGSTRIVGPPGSGVDVESTSLQDADPLNLANQADVPRIDLLDMGKVSRADAAIETGRLFLELAKLIDRSGSAEIVGHAIDDRGVVHPFHHVRAGDLGSWVDAADTSYRRIVRASHNHTSQSATLDIDAPPDALDALLQRMDVELVRLGIS
jgi:hypothetical protein